MAKPNLRKIERVEAPATPAGLTPDFQPIVIDFSQRRSAGDSIWQQPIFWLSAILIFVVTAGGMGFLMLNAQLQSLQGQNPYYLRADDPKIPPLPRQTLNPPAVSLLPILKRLPVGQNEAAPKTRAPENRFSISVTRNTRAEQFKERAAREAEAGNGENAIRAYNAALKVDPQDRDAAYNLTALLLQKAAALDGDAQWDEAAALYQKALRLWGADDAMGQSIRARLDWVQNKQAAIEKSFFPVSTGK